MEASLTQADADLELERFRQDFPSWQVFFQAGIWYATGPCSCCESRNSRTLHAPNAEGLRGQLTEVVR